ncbi:Hsp20/alpha crystallin family protein [Notoacmeibacter marinus]|uniref:Hsp20/alpha crystallin family protein n=1 Tax=Notoacmeibacter marinus TaxID=1876515 RepID=UPI000DF2FE22|nr:Hsp20/alpha crystallin family protein [Notoacmeibacter marinus]
MLNTPLSRSFGRDPFTQMRQLQADMNRLFEGAPALRTARPYPPINLWLGENSVVATAELPGLGQDDIDLTIQEDTLTIAGARERSADDGDVAWHRRERPVGRFSRTVDLPFRVDPDQVEARFTNGVLSVEMQRPEADRPRRIAVNAK